MRCCHGGGAPSDFADTHFASARLRWRGGNRSCRAARECGLSWKSVTVPVQLNLAPIFVAHCPHGSGEYCSPLHHRRKCRLYRRGDHWSPAVEPWSEVSHRACAVKSCAIVRGEIASTAVGGEPDVVFIILHEKTLNHLISQLSLTASPQGEANFATDSGRVVKCCVTVTDFRPRRNSGRAMLAPTVLPEVPTKAAPMPPLCKGRWLEHSESRRDCLLRFAKHYNGAWQYGFVGSIVTVFTQNAYP